MSVSYNIRLDEDLKNEAFEVFRRYRISPAQAIKMFLKVTAETKTTPLDFKYQANASTLEAVRELRKGQGQVYESLEAMLADVKHEEV